MSKENALKFLEKMEKDPVFREKLNKIKDASERKKMLLAAHLDFDKHDIEAAMKEKYKKPLTEEQLKKVVAAGGKGKPQSFEQYKQYIRYISTSLEE